MKNTEFDVLISSHSPITSHLIAKKIKQINSSIYWLADYRDLWFGNHFGSNPIMPLNLIQKKIERNINASADSLITVSKPLKEELTTRGKNKVLVIENGYFAEDVKSEVQDDCDDEIIRIVYTGVYYPEKYNSKPLFLAVKNLLDQNILSESKIKIQFYGENSLYAKQPIKSTELSEEIVEVFDRISREEVLEIQRKATILLFIGHESPETKGVLTGKLFEYMIANKPILAIGISTDNAAGNLIIISKTGYVCGDDVDKIADAIKKVLNKDPFQPNHDVISYYRRDKTIARLADHIKSQLKERKS